VLVGDELMDVIPTSGQRRVTFQQERAQDCFAEAKPLLEAHWQEVAHFPDQPLDPDWDSYRAIEDAGLVRAYTIRVEHELAGYALFFVRPNLHATATLTAVQDILYVTPSLRARFGRAFIAWCDRRLHDEGVQVVCHGVPERNKNFGPLLEHLGYERINTVYARRLDQKGA
jgi:hypothetical protein